MEIIFLGHKKLLLRTKKIGSFYPRIAVLSENLGPKKPEVLGQEFSKRTAIPARYEPKIYLYIHNDHCEMSHTMETEQAITK